MADDGVTDDGGAMYNVADFPESNGDVQTDVVGDGVRVRGGGVVRVRGGITGMRGRGDAGVRVRVLTKESQLKLIIFVKCAHNNLDFTQMHAS